MEFDALAARLRLLEDRAAVADVLDDYVYALDAQRWPELADLFAGDAVLECDGLDYRNPGRDGTYAGRDAILADFYGAGRPRRTSAGPFRTGHYGTNQRVRLAGDEATAVAYYLEIVNDTEVIAGTYEQRMRRDDDRWRLTFLRISVMYRGTLEGSGFGGRMLADIGSFATPSPVKE
jgi:hypothetical protein